MPDTTTPTPQKVKWYRHWFFCIIVAALVIAGLYFGGNYWMNCLIDKKHTEINKTIRQVLLEQSHSDALFPDIVLINKNGKLDTSFNKDIQKQLSDFLSAKYLSSDKSISSNFNLQPYLNILGEKDSIITKGDLSQIKKHIEFLASTVDKAVEASKHDIDIEIAKVNTWVTIWIGIIGVIGIFLPIVINIKSLEDLKNIKEKIKKANKNADKAKSQLETYEPQLTALPGLIAQVGGFEDKINKQEKRIASLDSQYTDIETKASNAETESLNTQKLLVALNAIFKLKDIDGNFLVYNNEPLKTLIKYLEDICIELTQAKNNYAHPIIKDALRQLALRIYLLSFYPFVTKEHIKQFNKISISITEKLEIGLSEESYQAFLDDLQLFISNLKINN